MTRRQQVGYPPLANESPAIASGASQTKKADKPDPVPRQAGVVVISLGQVLLPASSSRPRDTDGHRCHVET